MSKLIWDDTFYSETEDVALDPKLSDKIIAHTLEQQNEQEEKREERVVTKNEQSLSDNSENQFQDFDLDAFNDEDDDEEDPELIFNARMRLEQGRLYEMLLSHNLFEGTSAHPKAIANVEKEIKRFVKERLEVLLGLKPDPKIVSKIEPQQMPQLPFNELEISLLKQVLSKMTNGATEKANKQEVVVKPETKVNKLSLNKPEPLKLNSIKSNTMNNQNNQPVKPNLASKPQAKAKELVKPKEPISEPPPLNKSPFEMSAKELMERNRIISEKQKRAKAVVPDHQKLPMPSADALVAYYSKNQEKIMPIVNAILNKMPNK